MGDLTPGQSYCFRVSGINDAGEGPFSAGTDAVTAIAPPATPEPPTTDEVRRKRKKEEEREGRGRKRRKRK